MLWTQSKTLALAQQACTLCLGLGLRRDKYRRETACKCVLRAIFRACHARFRKCSTREPQMKRQAWNPQTLSKRGSQRNGELSTAARGRPERTRYGFPDQEYVADFLAIAKRALSEDDPRRYQIFRFHFLLGADWKACCRRLGTNRGDFFHEVYRIEEKLGRVFAELEPYALWPLDEYFGGTVRGRKRASPLESEPATQPAAKLRFPLKAAA